MSDEPPSSTVVSLPKGVWNAHLFQFFNAVSWTIVIGAPTLLFFKNLGATSTILGVVAALPPALIVMQLPAARWMESVGYKKFVLRGWMSRSIFILAMALIALLPDSIDATTRMVLMITFLFGFNLLRGISTVGVMPWMTQWVPEEVRGKFLGRDQFAGALAGLSSLVLMGKCLHLGNPSTVFGGMYAFAFIAALASIYFLRKIPDIPMPAVSKSPQAVPWNEIIFYPPFLKLLKFNFVWISAGSAAGVFWLPLMRDEFQAHNDLIMYMPALCIFFMAVTLLTAARWVDRVGSRPLIFTSGLVTIFHLMLWGAMAARMIPYNLTNLCWIQITGGIGNGLFQIANMRLVMATVPVMGRSHFFAVYSVVVSVTMACCPVLWGLMLDSLRGLKVVMWGWEWTPYSILYTAISIIIGISLLYLRKVQEPRAMSTLQFLNELLIETPAHSISRLLPKRPL